MAKFVVVTHSTFEHRYLVEANNAKEAIENTLMDYSLNYYQKDLGEEAVSTELVDDIYPMHEISRELGYY